MQFAATAISILLALLLIPIAIGQLRGNLAQLEALDAVNVPRERIPLIASLQLCGAAGLLAGIAWPLLGVAAALGTALLFVSALVVHARARNANVAPAVVMLVLATAAAILLSLAGGGPARAATTPTCSGPPVVVLPDFASGTSSATALATKIRDVGRCPHVLAYGKPRLTTLLPASVPVPIGGMEAIDRSVAEITPTLARIAGTDRTIDVVGVGIGSLVTLRYQQIAHNPVKIRRHVAIGALWNGTNVAGLATLEQLSRDAGSYDTVLPIEKLLLDGLCASCREMLTGSDFMRTLAKAGKLRPGTSVVSIISSTDGLVVPYTSGALAGTRTITVQDRNPKAKPSHFGLPYDKTVLTLVGGALG